MLVRILSAWTGSPPCGVVAEVPDGMARERIQSGYAEAVTVMAPTVEAAVPPVAERAVMPAGRKGRR